MTAGPPTFWDPEGGEDRQNRQDICTVCGATVHHSGQQRHIEWHAVLTAAIGQAVAEIIEQRREVTDVGWFRSAQREQTRQANFGVRPAPAVTPAQRVKNAHAARKRNQARKDARGK